MNEKIKDLIWERDRSSCQECGRKLTEKKNYYDEVHSQFIALKEIKIFKWVWPCWKCGEDTPIFTYNFFVGYNFHIGDVRKLDIVLAEKYPSVKKIITWSGEERTIANVCTCCGALQGNWHVMEKIVEMESDEVNFEELVDLVVPNTFDFEDFVGDEDFETSEQRMSIGHVHHKDRNRDNNDPENLVLLCRDCHFKIHSKDN